MIKSDPDPWTSYAIAGIFLLFVIRLFHIDLPPMDTHYFRQALTLGVARNYIEWDPNFFHPRSLLCDSRGGLVVSEFPVYNYAISILWRAFGQHNWVFRLFTLIISSFGLWHFFQIGRRITSAKASFAATVLFGTSIAFIYARKAMPDVFSLSLVMIGVSYGWSYLESGKSWRLFLFTILTAVGILSKIPSATMAVLIAWPLFFEKNIELKRKVWVCAGSLFAVISMAAWYFVWIPMVEKQLGQVFYFRLGIETAWHQVINHSWLFTKERFYPIALQSRLAYIFLVSGLCLMLIKRDYKLIFPFILVSIVFLVFILQVGEVFSMHEYYIIPYVPVMALIAGYGGAAMIKNKWIFISILVIMAGEAMYRKHDDFILAEKDKRILKIEEIANKTIPEKSRIMVVSEPISMPSLMYFSHRKGWQEFDLKRIYDRSYIIGESTVGLEYLVADRLKMPDTIDYPMVYQDDDFSIFRIIGEK